MLLRPTKLLFAGIAGSALVVSAGLLNHVRLHRLVASTEVKLPSLKATADECFQGYENAWRRKELELTGKPARGLPVDKASEWLERCPEYNQAETLIEQARADDRRSQIWTQRIAIAVLVGLSAPWLWYFFLRRIVELRGAILGKPPGSL